MNCYNYERTSRVSRLECYTQCRITKMSRLHEVEMSVDVVERKNAEMMVAWYLIGPFLMSRTDRRITDTHTWISGAALHNKPFGKFVNKKRKDFLFSASDIPTVYYFDFTQQLVFRHYDFQTVIYYNFGKFLLEKCNENARWNLCRRNSNKFHRTILTGPNKLIAFYLVFWVGLDRISEVQTFRNIWARGFWIMSAANWSKTAIIAKIRAFFSFQIPISRSLQNQIVFCWNAGWKVM